jgi:hypothetical protein
MLALITLLPSALSAQSAYARSGDTLRFRETTDADMRISGPQGEIAMKHEHRATIAFARLPNDTARAWYESLTLSLAGPGGSMQPATDSALNAPFALTFDDRGRTRLVAAPKFPASFEGITDLTHQFDDFFPRLPRQPLRVGVAWTDTSTRIDSTADKSMRWTSIATYRVERDTAVDGVPGVVVRMTQQLRSRSEGPVPNQPVRAETQLEGTEEGFFVFAVRQGRLLGRRRQGSLNGRLVMKAPSGQFEMKQSYDYRSSIDPVRR